MKIIKALALLTIMGLLLKPSIVFAWDDCPKEMVNDPYPGECARYIDTDNDGICDHSQPAPDNRVENLQDVEEVTKNNKEYPADNLVSDNLLSDKQQVDDTKQINNVKPQNKVFLAFGLVLAHLVAILIYATYNRTKQKNITV